MPTPIHKVTHNPIPTSLFCFNMLFVINARGKAQHLGIQLPARCDHVGMGLWVTLCIGVGIFLFLSFSWSDIDPYIPPSFHRNDFSTCSTHFSFGAKHQPFFAPRAHILYTRACPAGRPPHADNAPPAPAPPCTHVYNRMLWRCSVSAREEPHDLP